MLEKVKTTASKIGAKIAEHKDTVVKTALGVGGTIAGLGILKFVADRKCDDYDYDLVEVEEYEVIEDCEDAEECEETEGEEE